MTTLTTAPVPAARADYGLDAPGVVRNLALGALAGALLALLVSTGVLPAFLDIPVGGNVIRLGLFGVGAGPALGLGFAAVAMTWSSRVGKFSEREQLLDRLSWTGEERVLDVGCGRGLMLIAAARRLTTGRAVGIDLWRAEDLSGNHRDATLANAAIEGVADRVTVETGDMRALPFPAASFDRIVSRAVIHNLDRADDRARAIGEMVRVLAPGGAILLDDIRHAAEYQRAFTEAGCTVRRVDARLASLLWSLMSFGGMSPVTLVATK